MRYKLTTAAIVTALHPNEPRPKGTIWEPKVGADLTEAEALRNVGYAETTNEKATDLTREEQANQQRAPLTGIVDANKFDPETEAELQELLGGTVQAIGDSLGEYTVEALNRLAELEAAGQNRKGVIEAIARAKAESEE